jgi:hypothetical protein
MAKERKVDLRSNEVVTEIRYPANARVLDRRGEWTAILSDEFDLKQWAIDENTVKLSNADGSRLVSVSFRNAIVMGRDLSTKNLFPDYAAKVVNRLVGFEGFGSSLYVERLGVRSKFCNQFKGSFIELVQAFAQRYVTPSQGIATVFGAAAKLVDMGAPLNFEDSDDFYNTNCGPMKRGQLRQFFTKDDGFPEVGLYFEVDYFTRPRAVLKPDNVIETISRLALRSWEFNERVRHLVTKS